MKTLFFDLASHEACIACVDDTSTVAFESVHARIGDHELLPMTEKVLASAGWSFEDLEGVACIVGPGGFTSLRVAATYANVLADQLCIPSAGIHLSELYNARVKSDTSEVKSEDVYWMHSTKKDQLFIQGGEWEVPTLISIDDLSSLNWMGELIPEHREKITADHVHLEPITDVLPGFLRAQKYDTQIVQPWYGRGW
ncbi:MAG: tRNA (adenosine(37)-N6)-threonylcarbamoyltransferase complex dimerization subunit type 1 TsaB [bacterium]|nr:tRNA (adenosine(37)-N6)-threonylcarbamoyltransferase complex dimerization subunit type 1 TsaB [bacterium]MDA1292828.1 tRNA (adenosine(37)-N6)-threonylcarbamoyltransferase complex dimerization subunit type 1 TsaB [bacterium]